MFAVPGWTLPSGPAEQTDPSAAAKKKTKTKRGKTKKAVATGSNSVDVAPEPEKKEKETAAFTAVTADNVEALWRKVIVGESGGKKRKRGSSGGKKRAAAAVAAAKADDTEEAPGKGKEGEEEAVGLPRKKTSKEKRREKKAAAAGVAVDVAPTAAAAAPPGAADTAKLTPLQQKMRAKLTSARFRHINETLYTTASTASLSLFAAQPEMYGEYHQGFRQQVAVWPSNPVDAFVGALRERAGLKFQKGYSRALHATAVQPLPRDRDSGVCTVADLGCGDAKIAATFNHGGARAENIHVLSFDLQASTPDVTVADIASLPLEKESVDVAIFCLALMGTNFLDFVDEAHRVLRWRGELWVAEIKSRFHRSKADDGGEPEMEGGEKRGVPPAYANFVEALQKRGFALRGSVDDRNKMFVRMEFVKLPADAAGGKPGKPGEDTLGRAADRRMPKKPKFIEAELKEDMIMKPCVYKLR